jgi:transcriptional regulator with XRE-family HTH domain
MHLKQVLSTNLVKLRKDQKIKAITIAKNANITRQYYSDIERGKTSPSLATLEALANALNVPPWVLLKEENIETKENETR